MVTVKKKKKKKNGFVNCSMLKMEMREDEKQSQLYFLESNTK